MQVTELLQMSQNIMIIYYYYAAGETYIESSSQIRNYHI